MKYFYVSGAVATGTSPVEVHYGLSGRAIKELCVRGIVILGRYLV